MKDTFYFPHDCNARLDPKIIELRIKYKEIGYAWFFMLLEYMAGEANSHLNREAIATLCMGMGIDSSHQVELKDFIEDCIKVGLLKSDGKTFWNERMCNWKKSRENFKKYGKEGAKKRWMDKEKDSPPISHPNSHPNSPPYSIKVNYIKLKEKKDIVKEKVVECKNFLEEFNQLRGTKYTAYEHLLANFTYWTTVYTLEQILEAVTKVSAESWFNDKLTPDLLLRRKNPQGETVDYIGRILNESGKPKEKYKTIG
jgi:hypothetical protein